MYIIYTHIDDYSDHSNTSNNDEYKYICFIDMQHA